MPRDPRLIGFARQLRRNLTPAERILWKALRGRRFDELKFRRQYLLGMYVLDFFCPTLVLEALWQICEERGLRGCQRSKDSWYFPSPPTPLPACGKRGEEL
jgi:very-short-patch-repair endonuclease